MGIELPQEVHCKVTCDGNPVSRLALMAILKTSRKNEYDIFMGPTTENGYAHLLRDQILSYAAAKIESAMMDYCLIEKVFTGRMSVHVMTAAELKAALEGYEIYKDYFPFPRGYVHMLRDSMAVVEHLGYERLAIEATVVPESIELTIGDPSKH